MENNQELKEILNSKNTALLIWDVQNRLVRNIFNTEEFLTNSKKVIASAHEKGIPVIFSKSNPLPEKFQSSVMKYLMKNIRANMPQNIAPDSNELSIEPKKEDIVIPKNTASMFIGTNFEMLLRNSGITTIVFIGIATEFGIESTARDAMNRGFFPVIITDAVSSFNKEGHERSLLNLKNMMILLKSEEIISLW